MKKVLLSGVAVIALAASPALAQESPLKLGVGGYFNGYVAHVDQDTVEDVKVKRFDMLRNTEIHLTGETTLDNGLTVGLHFEMEADGNDAFEVEESYMYLSGAWGRVNVGAEDGAAYLLQVAAPSADANVDGIRQLIQPVNYTAAFGPEDLAEEAFLAGLARLDYAQDPTGYADKITYLTPVLNGFQAGITYVPQVGNLLVDDANASASGVRLRNPGEPDEPFYRDAWEGAVRYEGQFEQVGFALGAGYSYLRTNSGEVTITDGVSTVDLALTKNEKIWNVGADVDFGPFGVGAAYVRDNNGGATIDGIEVGRTKTWVLGVDYTTGPFKLGATYFRDETDLDGARDFRTNRYTGGVVYTYGPGMTFRGAIQYVDHKFDADVLESAGRSRVDATSVLVGTQVLF